MNILVTGGAGLIGAAVVELLLQEDDSDVTVFDIATLPPRLAERGSRFVAIRGDLGNFSHVLDAVEKTRPELIFHLGGMLSLDVEADPPRAFQTNAVGTFNILEACRLFNVPQVVFSSTMASYGYDIEGDTISDKTLQRPMLFYGATKVFGEHLGLFYRRKYDLDFRGLRFPAIVGPGVKSAGIAQYNSRIIEECALGRPYTVYVKPETRHGFMYVKDAARSLIELARAPREQIKTVNYVLAGMQPPPSAQELAAIVQQKLPTAKIDFKPDPVSQEAVDRLNHPVDDSNAKREWGWQIRYSIEAMVDDFLAEMDVQISRNET